MRFKDRDLGSDNWFMASVLFLAAFTIAAIFGVLAWGAARGSGTYTTYCVSSPCEKLYLINSSEEPGWDVDNTTNSVNRNALIISTAINRLEVLAGNTNYIQLTNSLQTGATFYVSSATVNSFLDVNGGINTRMAIGTVSANTIAPLTVAGTDSPNQKIRIVGANHQGIWGTDANGVILNSLTNGQIQFDTNNGAVSVVIATTSVAVVGIGTTAPSSILHVSSAAGFSGSMLKVSTGSTSLFEVGSSSISLGVNTLVTSASSITLQGATTFFFTSPNSQIYYSSPTLASTIMLNSGTGILLRSSAPAQSANVTPDFETLNVIPSSEAIHGVILKVFCSLNQDSGADAASITLYLRASGSSDAASELNQVCTVGAELASEVGRDMSFAVMAATRSVEMSCASGGVTGSRRCVVWQTGTFR